MAKISKRMKALSAKYDLSKPFALNDAIEAVKACANAKFDEASDVAIQLGIDPRKSDQAIRGAVVMPEGTGKTIRVAVFTQGARVEQAKDAGADIVGFDDLAAEIKGGRMDFDVVIASPDAMRVVGQLGQILGPRGLMPNPKAGTVTPDVAKAITEAKAGKIEYRLDKTNIIHCPIGKASFGTDKLLENFNALLDAIIKAKPASSKGQYIKSVAVASTMGPGVKINPNKVGTVASAE